ncbi:MAG: hypothetical protein QT02_C0009G0002 [archaeon GW2011_AR9]|nr:MAG: hypothetical protein QT02_C0009G0002 [archaeon GW2011_AR9]
MVQDNPEYAGAIIQTPSFKRYQVPYSVKLEKLQHGDRIQFEEEIGIVNSWGHTHDKETKQLYFILGTCTSKAYESTRKAQQEQQNRQIFTNFLSGLSKGKKQKLIRVSKAICRLYTLDDLISFSQQH